MIRPKLRQLEYLTTLQDEKSFSKAALACNVTQSTLSAGIKELEEILGQQLVNRKGREITLTALGEEISEQARSIIGNVDHIVARAQAQKMPLCGTLRLGVIPTIAPYLLPSLLPDIQNSFPNLELQLHEGLSEPLVEKIHMRQLDGAIIAFPYDSDGLEHHDLFDEAFYLAAPKNKVLPKNLSIKDIKPEELLLLEDGHCLRDHALAACKLQLPARRKTFSATSLATLIQMVSHGYGVTLLPEMVVKHAPMPDGIKLTAFKSPAPSRKIGMVWANNAPKKRDLDALYKLLKNS